MRISGGESHSFTRGVFHKIKFLVIISSGSYILPAKVGTPLPHSLENTRVPENGHTTKTAIKHLLQFSSEH